VQRGIFDYAFAKKSDSDIQSCIESKMTSDQKLKNQGFNLSMNNGVATYTGATKNSNSKSGVNSLAKSCGARQVVNNISVEKAASSSPSSTGTAKKAKTRQ
jgi:osmotically-inducible protein OsmY